ncbi:MAG TPA: HAD family hydrolase [Candidatus Saccharimonadia bacterium]|nr:HAD family hydrolase [Candidatus Saccharimonadia bacterium]
MVKAIIFDADGPLYYRTDLSSQKLEALLKDFGYCGDVKEFKRAYESEKFKAYVRFETEAEMDHKILQSIGVQISLSEAEIFAKKFDVIQRQVTATANAIAALKQLKNEDYKICVLTDSFYSSQEKWSWFKTLGMDMYIDHIVSSYDIRKLKDTPEAYQICLDSLGTNADETVFVGHQEYEMTGARASKITSIAVIPIATPGIHSDYKVNSLSELPELLKKINRI